MDEQEKIQSDENEFPSENPVLMQALERKEPRYFLVADGSVKGHTGRRDTARFADELVALQDCAQKIGERLGMSAIGYGIVYDGNDASAFRYDPRSKPENPVLVGALVNRRIPMRELLQRLDQHLKETATDQ